MALCYPVASVTSKDWYTVLGMMIPATRNGVNLTEWLPPVVGGVSDGCPGGR